MENTVDHIDIGALFGPAGPGRTTCDAALWRGLKRTGSVTIGGYPDADSVDGRARTGLQVFDLAPEVKRPLATRFAEPKNRHWYRGYWPRMTERLLQNEFFDVGPQHPAAGPDLPGMDVFEEPTPLPDPEPCPGWSAIVRAHYDHLNGVAQAMIRSVGRSAGFGDAEIAARFDGAHSTLRFLNYSKDAANAPGDPGDPPLSAGRHTDASGLSLLWQDGPGLQAQGQDGVFRDIPMVENAISVHLGDVMTGMTGGRVPATPHRVLAGGVPRRSVGFFLEPALTAPVTAADQPGPARVEDTYGWLLLDAFSKRPFWRDIIRPPEKT